MWYGDIVTPESFDELWLKEVRCGMQYGTLVLSNTKVEGFQWGVLCWCTFHLAVDFFNVGGLSTGAPVTFYEISTLLSVFFGWLDSVAPLDARPSRFLEVFAQPICNGEIHSFRQYVQRALGHGEVPRVSGS